MTRLIHDPDRGVFQDADTGAVLTRLQVERAFADFLERRRLRGKYGDGWEQTLRQIDGMLERGDKRAKVAA